VRLDTLTHSLLGALAVGAAFPDARLPQAPGRRQRLLVGAVAGAFPDIDYVTVWIDPLSYLAVWHRGITHSILLLPLWALGLGVLLAWLLRRREAWKPLALFAGLALATHIAADVITIFGTRVLAPLSSWRAALGTTFIVDPVFSAIVLTGFLAALRARPRRLPGASLLVLLLYVAGQGALKHHAWQIARQHADALGTAGAHALPQPFSPFFWKLVTETDGFYEEAYLDLWPWAAPGRPGQGSGLSRWLSYYQPPAALRWQRQSRFGSATDAGAARELWSRPQMARFRDFAVFPVLYRVDDRPDGRCYWFTDLRFELPFLPPPFRYGLCGARGRGWGLRRLD